MFLNIGMREVEGDPKRGAPFLMPRSEEKKSTSC